MTSNVAQVHWVQRARHLAFVIPLAGLLTTLSPVAMAEEPVLPSPAVETSHESALTYGVAVPPEMFPSPSRPTRMARMRTDLVKSGACVIRTDVTVTLVRAVKRYGWLGSHGECAKGNARIIAILDYYTLWHARELCPATTFSRTTGLADHFTLSDWRKLTRCVARQLKGRVMAYEIWNEPLLPAAQTGYQNGSVGHYYDLLRVASNQIRDVDPRAKIVALGGVDAYAPGVYAGRVTAAEAFSAKLAARGAARFADAVSVHAYPWGDYQDVSRLDAYQLSVRFHARVWGRPVWITETGHRRSEAGTQSGYLADAYGALLGAGARKIVWFSLYDARDGTFGIAGQPAQTAMAAYISAPKTGLLRVFTDPPVQSTITVTALRPEPDQSLTRAWAVDWARVQEGEYRITFSDVGLLDGQPAVMPAPWTVVVRPREVTIVRVDPHDGSVGVSYCWEGGRPCP